MILIAVGNTRTLLARTQDGVHFDSTSVATALPPTKILQQPGLTWFNALNREPIALGGVVPAALAAWREVLSTAAFREPDPGFFRRAVPHDYHPPESLGFDRRCCLLAAAMDCPRQDSIVIDMGTAITIDLLAGGYFRGGRILPGITMSLRSLHQGTALLPEVVLSSAAETLGNNTSDAIQAGIIHLFTDALRGAIADYRQHSPQAQILITGGDAERWQPGIPGSFYQPHLLLRGFYLWLQGDDAPP
jgi:type III pantothenate kinase